MHGVCPLVFCIPDLFFERPLIWRTYRKKVPETGLWAIFPPRSPPILDLPDSGGRFSGFLVLAKWLFFFPFRCFPFRSPLLFFFFSPPPLKLSGSGNFPLFPPQDFCFYVPACTYNPTFKYFSKQFFPQEGPFWVHSGIQVSFGRQLVSFITLNLFLCGHSLFGPLHRTPLFSPTGEYDVFFCFSPCFPPREFFLIFSCKWSLPLPCNVPPPAVLAPFTVDG